MSKKAFITGISGQDGSYLSELLLSEGYKVYGMIRRHSVAENQSYRIEHLDNDPNFHTFYGDMLDKYSLDKILKDVQPDEIYNLAAQSHVRISFDMPHFTMETNAAGVLNLLEAYRYHCPQAKLYQASSSEMFGLSMDTDKFQRESTPFNPVSPYGCAKVFAYDMCRHYRRAYGLFISNGILFNHESPRRGANFVTSKVVKGLCSIKLGLQEELWLGNLTAYRDWGHSKDYVRAMSLILNHPTPDEWIVSTGQTHTVRDLCEHVFEKLDMDYKDYVVQNPKYIRPEELKYLKGDSTRTREVLKWKPEYDFKTMLDEMIEHWMRK